MGENLDSNVLTASSASSGLGDWLKKAAAVLSALKEILTVFGVTVTSAAIAGWRTPALSLPVWTIALAISACAGIGAVIQYTFFARKQLQQETRASNKKISELLQLNQKLAEENARLRIITKLDTRRELGERIWQAVDEIWPRRGGPAEKGKELALAVVAIDPREEIRRHYPAEVFDRLLNTLERAIEAASPRDTDSVYLVDSKFYVVIQNQAERPDATRLPERIIDRSRNAPAWTLPDGRSSPTWRVCTGIAHFDMPYANPERLEERIQTMVASAESALEQSCKSAEQRIFWPN
jgi:GGDEF domain-containing protein